MNERSNYCQCFAHLLLTGLSSMIRQHLDYWGRLKALRISSLQRRRERFIIVHVWKILREITPNDLDFEFSETFRHGIRASVQCSLFLPSEIQFNPQSVVV